MLNIDRHSPFAIGGSAYAEDVRCHQTNCIATVETKLGPNPGQIGVPRSSETRATAEAF